MKLKKIYIKSKCFNILFLSLHKHIPVNNKIYKSYNFRDFYVVVLTLR